MVSWLGLPAFFFSWIGFLFLFRELGIRRQIAADWRLYWMLSCVSWGALLTLITEISSLLSSLNAPTLAMSWMLACAGLWAGVVLLIRHREGLSQPTFRWRKSIPSLERQIARVSRLPLEVQLMFASSAVMVAVLGALAFHLPTTNWDALTYHLPRIMHWIQQQSVDHYATGNTRQIEFGPWSAFALTHLYLFKGNDQLLNLVQWFAMISTAVALSMIGQQLIAFSKSLAARADLPAMRWRVEALIIGLLCTLPIGLVEAMTAQNDYVATAWLAMLVGFGLLLLQAPGHFWYALGAGLALGLGVATKALFLIYIAPAMLLFLLGSWRQKSPQRNRWALAGIGALMFLLLNSPYMLRNLSLFGSPLGSEQIVTMVRNEPLSTRAWFSNVIRNLALNTNSGFEPLTRGWNTLLEKAHRLTGTDVNDPTATFPLSTFEFIHRFYLYDSYASNPYHLALILGAGLIALSRPSRNKDLLAYASAFVVSFLIFCAYLRWQEWHTRFHLAYFTLLIPFVAVILVGQFSRWIVLALFGVVQTFAVYCLIQNRSLPLPHHEPSFAGLPREHQYVAVYQPVPIYPNLSAIAQDIVASRCTNIGVKLGFDDCEYPIWVLLKKAGFQGTIAHVWVDNVSRQIPKFTPFPCVVISRFFGELTPSLKQKLPYQVNYGWYRVHWSKSASRWCELLHFDGKLQAMRTQPEQRLPWRGGQIKVVLRSARAGWLQLTASLNSRANHTLLIKTESGFSTEMPLTNSPVSLTIPTESPRTEVKIFLKNGPGQPGGDADLDPLQWNWQPKEKD